MGYRASDLAIEASYPLGRITVGYTGGGGIRDSFKVEVGYMRRISVLKADVLSAFRHPAGGEGFRVLTPAREELFANKWCTMLYRGSSRDLFEVYRIAGLGVDLGVFRVCAVVDSLMRGLPMLHEVDVEKVVGGIPVDSGLRNLLHGGGEALDVDEMRGRVLEFSRVVQSGLSEGQREAIRVFHLEKRFSQELVDRDGVLNPEIRDHPSILRALQGS